MKSLNITFMIRNCLFLNLIIIFCAYSFIKISTDKNQYLKYEPVYLEIEYIDSLSPEGFYKGSLVDDRSDIDLVIINPTNNVIKYSPPLHIRRYANADDDNVFFETLLISDGQLIFSEVGTYILYVAEKGNRRQLSNNLNVTIEKSVSNDELHLQCEIEKHALDYGWFVYLNGGDQFEYEKEIVNVIVNINLRYKSVAKVILAINNSEIKYDWKNKRIERDKDFKGIKELFMDNTEIKCLPNILKWMLMNRFIDNFESEKISKELNTKILEVYHSNRTNFSRFKLSKNWENKLEKLKTN